MNMKESCNKKSGIFEGDDGYEGKSLGKDNLSGLDIWINMVLI